MGHIAGKHVTQPTNGFDQGGLVRVNLDLPAQAHDQHVDRAIEHVSTFAVGQLKQSIAAQHPTGILRKGQQQAVLALG